MLKRVKKVRDTKADLNGQAKLTERGQKENIPPPGKNNIESQLKGKPVDNAENQDGIEKQEQLQTTRVGYEDNYTRIDASSNLAKHEKLQKTISPSSRKLKHNQEEISEYERQRLENIRKNQEMLRFLELPASMPGMDPSGDEKPTTVAIEITNTPAKIRRPYTKKAPKVIQPARTSNRLRGFSVAPLEIGENDALENETHLSKQENRHLNNDTADTDSEGDEEINVSTLMSGDLFFDQEVRDKAIRVDGHYKGWLNSDVVERYGFEKSAQEAWEANGGGTFSFKDPLGHDDQSVNPSSRKSKKPKHDAKLVAKAMFKKNPNAFFYRHNEPGQGQWTGDWTEEEGKLFLEVAKEFGCGDKWGLFASHIPHRVGYQCSNYYRQVDDTRQKEENL
ncbi:hypothetical protein BGZ76_003812 [Entomortierella beljakovae]|nr:hypothetical protein BGZ76_003812 [Entomortierella beljakovae]